MVLPKCRCRTSSVGYSSGSHKIGFCTGSPMLSCLSRVLWRGLKIARVSQTSALQPLVGSSFSQGDQASETRPASPTPILFGWTKSSPELTNGPEGTCRLAGRLCCFAHAHSVVPIMNHINSSISIRSLFPILLPAFSIPRLAVRIIQSDFHLPIRSMTCYEQTKSRSLLF